VSGYCGKGLRGRKLQTKCTFQHSDTINLQPFICFLCDRGMPVGIVASTLMRVRCLTKSCHIHLALCSCDIFSLEVCTVLICVCRRDTDCTLFTVCVCLIVVWEQCRVSADWPAVTRHSTRYSSDCWSDYLSQRLKDAGTTTAGTAQVTTTVTITDSWHCPGNYYCHYHRRLALPR